MHEDVVRRIVEVLEEVPSKNRNAILLRAKAHLHQKEFEVHKELQGFSSEGCPAGWFPGDCCD
ncbi:hypothetical protein KKB69_01715 [Patescibacteria group bacterium]|nr:hypothetical protein [Patescibacteria group bacterium]